MQTEDPKVTALRKAVADLAIDVQATSQRMRAHGLLFGEADYVLAAAKALCRVAERLGGNHATLRLFFGGADD